MRACNCEGRGRRTVRQAVCCQQASSSRAGALAGGENNGPCTKTWWFMLFHQQVYWTKVRRIDCACMVFVHVVKRVLKPRVFRNLRAQTWARRLPRGVPWSTTRTSCATSSIFRHCDASSSNQHWHQLFIISAYVENARRAQYLHILGLVSDKSQGDKSCPLVTWSRSG